MVGGGGPWRKGEEAAVAGVRAGRSVTRRGVCGRAHLRPRLLPGRAVQLDPIKPTFKAPEIKSLKLEYDRPLSQFAFKFNLRRYIQAQKVMESLRSLAHGEVRAP